MGGSECPSHRRGGESSCRQGASSCRTPLCRPCGAVRQSVTLRMISDQHEFICGRCGCLETNPSPDPLLTLAIAEGRARCRNCIAGKPVGDTTSVEELADCWRQHIGTKFDGFGLNEFGTLISHHTCGACGRQYTVCPATPDDDACLAPPGSGLGGTNGACPSYDPRRDVDKMLEGGTADIRAVPIPPRGSA